MKKRTQNKTPVLGITGVYGGGKTTAARMFKDLGARGIDADRIYRQLLKPGADIYRRILAAYGRDALGRSGRIDRKKLGQLVFGQKQKLKLLCRITHPAIIREIKNRLKKLKKDKGVKLIVIDAPLLIESGLAALVDILIVVGLSQKKLIARCFRGRKISKDEIAKRIKSQMPLTKKIGLADFIIDNNGSRAQTRAQVFKIWQRLKINI